MVNLYLNKQSLDFKIDTGADVTVIPTYAYRKSEYGPLKSSSRLLKGADQQPLQVIGSFTGKLLPYSGNLLREEIFANPAILLSEEIFAIFDFNLLGDFCD